LWDLASSNNSWTSEASEVHEQSDTNKLDRSGLSPKMMRFAAKKYFIAENVSIYLPQGKQSIVTGKIA
jgi:hypothetical protein